MHSTDVLVAGAGPVGLMMACELRRHGVTCRLIDPLPEPAHQCKAVGIQPRTLEIWEDMGIALEAIDAGLWLRGMRLYVNGEQRAETIMDLPDVPYGFLALPQYETERILTAHLNRFGTMIERQTALVSFLQNEEGVMATVRGNGGIEQVSCRYLVGCDGAHSVVRHALGLPFEGERYAEQYMLGDVEVQWDLPHGWSYRFLHVADGTMDDFLVCIPIPGKNRYRLSMFGASEFGAARRSGEVDHGLAKDGPQPTLAHIQTVVSRLAPTGTTVGDLRWACLFGLSHRIVSRYSVHRVFLAGDAAHIHPPTGAQGMNTGLQDAYNLAWKLALVLKGTAPPSFLESYNAERLPIGQEVVGRTHHQAEAQRQGITETARDRLMTDSQLLVHYRGSTWVGQDVDSSETFTHGPAPGERAPDVLGLRREGIGFPLRLFDVLRGTAYVLLFYVGSGGRDEVQLVAEIATSLRARFGEMIRPYAIIDGSPNLIAFGGLPVLQDTDGAFRRVYDTAATSAYLIRPDGYIAYRCSPVRSDSIITYLKRMLG
jgi:2-polyprenyl-6-methoxyphenol hydroxylase-like FAD-dependent oxidoreductase